jgi:hypothetical protein
VLAQQIDRNVGDLVSGTWSSQVTTTMALNVLQGAGLDTVFVTATGGSAAKPMKDWARDIDGATSAQVQPLLSKIKRGIDDPVILVLGDSTGNDTNEWVYLVTSTLGARFPTHTFKYSLWNGTSYPAPTTMSTGSGPRTVTVYNGSVAGSRTLYPPGGRWAVMVAAQTPELIFVNYGHNQGTTAPALWRSVYLPHTEALSEEHRGAGIVLMLQNPSTVDNYQAQRNAVWEQIAQERGYGT